MRRILLLHGVVLSIGGIPLLYLGDEVGTLNDYAYRADPAKAATAAGSIAPRFDRRRLARAEAAPESVEGACCMGSAGCSSCAWPAQHSPAATCRSSGSTTATRSPSCAGVRPTGCWSWRNLSEHRVVVPGATVLRQTGAARFASLTEGRELDAAAGLAVEPYGFLVLRPLVPGAAPR